MRPPPMDPSRPASVTLTEPSLCNIRISAAFAQAEQAAGVLKGIASAFGFDQAGRGAADVARVASASAARCPECGAARPLAKWVAAAPGSLKTELFLKREG